MPWELVLEMNIGSGNEPWEIIVEMSQGEGCLEMYHRKRILEMYDGKVSRHM